MMTTRSVDLNWKMRASRVLPMFLLPALSSLAYSGLVNFSRICDRKNQKTLERLRAERQAKLDEFKEKSNYYITQQLIQKFDTDPAAKAAAATVLASKLGAESGLKLHVGDEFNLLVQLERATMLNLQNPVTFAIANSLNQSLLAQGELWCNKLMDRHLKNSEIAGINTFTNNNQLVVGHHQPELNTNGGGWIARFAALLVGEDPTQSYALICGNCHMHNGLAREEDFLYITYYCPHCNALNKSQYLDGAAISEPGNVSSLAAPSINNPVKSDSAIPMKRALSCSNPTVATVEAKEVKPINLGIRKWLVN